MGQIKEGMVLLYPRETSFRERSLRPNVTKFESYKGRGWFPGFGEVFSKIFLRGWISDQTPSMISEENKYSSRENCNSLQNHSYSD